MIAMGAKVVRVGRNIVRIEELSVRWLVPCKISEDIYWCLTCTNRFQPLSCCTIHPILTKLAFQVTVGFATDGTKVPSTGILRPNTSEFWNRYVANTSKAVITVHRILQKQIFSDQRLCLFRISCFSSVILQTRSPLQWRVLRASSTSCADL